MKFYKNLIERPDFRYFVYRNNEWLVIANVKTRNAPSFVYYNNESSGGCGDDLNLNLLNNTNFKEVSKEKSYEIFPKYREALKQYLRKNK